ncbi:ADP-ribosylglycohydrolase family protein [Neobittarella massiliensis]|uniref:ADP-ribosylglycohydrolase family protein n=2 Tax=Oscillospiraceae TaxID=216572 RepID=A0A8J6INQ7_9FIRM|nr:ADP-ribosylglycohydrolase family protein [Neobittarella massiliensis]MBC3517139.1 ADP-ribosylglycohydrolase family protein [Neobittarella massiliensis]SCJ73158.1 ADP-ribosyl-[dinitrogen reductase] hydrolase [uncultured Anaerotruncus sp.]
MERYKRILGGLTLAAAADSIGTVTETRSMDLIKEYFGGFVRDFRQAPEDTFARGAEAGLVSDDFSLAYYTALAIIKNKGVINDKTASDALLDWAADPRYFEAFAGPTTKAAVYALQGHPVQGPYPFLACDNAKASNGSAMKIEAVGYIHPGDLDAAIDDAITMCMPTHGNDIALSAGCAVAAACAKAMEDDADLFSIVEAGLYGARVGYEKGGKVGKRLAGASVEKRIKLAVSIAMQSESLEDAMREIAAIIGCGLRANEAVPAAFGLLIAAKGDPVEAILAAVNMGDDTDTVATIVGSIAGAYAGIDALPAHYLTTIDRVNKFDLEGTAKALDALID